LFETKLIFSTSFQRRGGFRAVPQRQRCLIGRLKCH